MIVDVVLPRILAVDARMYGLVTTDRILDLIVENGITCSCANAEDVALLMN